MNHKQITKLKRLKKDRVNELIDARMPDKALMYNMVLEDILEALTSDLSNMEFTADPQIHVPD